MGAIKPRTKPKAEDVAKQEPKPLYVRRDLLNGAEFVRWAKGQGFTTTLPQANLHVTICYSRSPVDWMACGQSYSCDPKGELVVQPGGPRMIERFGDAVVLLFASSELNWRHEWIEECGASFDFDEYQPHVTISWSAPDGLDLDKVEPFQGALRFGPEIFEEIDEDWRQGIVEKSFSGFFKVSGVDEGLGLVFGWAIICKQDGKDYVDAHDNHVPEDAMVEATTDFMKNSRVHGDMHERGTTARMPAGAVVHSFPLTTEIAKAMGIETKQTGWMVATAPDPAMLKKFKTGEYTGFSIGGEHIEIDGRPVAELLDA